MKSSLVSALGLAFYAAVHWTSVADAWSRQVPVALVRPRPITTPSCLASSASVEKEEATTIAIDDSQPRSSFGTKEYWDDVYAGRGDFPAEEYAWYYDWDVLRPVVRDYLSGHLLVPGVGNDPLLVDLVRAGGFAKVTAQDYSAQALERQEELLEDYGLMDSSTTTTQLELTTGDVRELARDWQEGYGASVRVDAILEKGLLDAVYLSGEGQVELAVDNLRRVLKAGGIFMSVSGVVPADLRSSLFDASEWECLRDGSADLKAGIFVWKKR